MKKVLMLMIGLGLVLGTVTTSFAQEPTKKASKKKSGKKKEETPKKEGSR